MLKAKPVLIHDRTADTVMVRQPTRRQLEEMLKAVTVSWMCQRTGSLKQVDGRFFKLLKAIEPIPRRCEVELNANGECFPTRLLEESKKPRFKAHNDTGRDIPQGYYFWALMIGKPKDTPPLIQT